MLGKLDMPLVKLVCDAAAICETALDSSGRWNIRLLHIFLQHTVAAEARCQLAHASLHSPEPLPRHAVCVAVIELGNDAFLKQVV
jgi:hypothetical protein